MSRVLGNRMEGRGRRGEERWIRRSKEKHHRPHHHHRIIIAD